jgi:hypothetical protein
MKTLRLTLSWMALLAASPARAEVEIDVEHFSLREGVGCISYGSSSRTMTICAGESVDREDDGTDRSRSVFFFLRETAGDCEMQVSGFGSGADVAIRRNGTNAMSASGVLNVFSFGFCDSPEDNEPPLEWFLTGTGAVAFQLQRVGNITQDQVLDFELDTAEGERELEISMQNTSEASTARVVSDSLSYELDTPIPAGAEGLTLLPGVDLTTILSVTQAVIARALAIEVEVEVEISR